LALGQFDSCQIHKKKALSPSPASSSSSPSAVIVIIHAHDVETKAGDDAPRDVAGDRAVRPVSPAGPRLCAPHAVAKPLLR